MIKEGIKYGDY